jgi:phosphatidylinositol alpha 1,6-mannosyltransferase
MNSLASSRAMGGKPALTVNNKLLQPGPVQSTDLRVALFSGNYNYVRDGANQALNRLVDYLLRQGVQVRVYSPTVAEPAFPPTGDLVSIPSLAIPGRSEYRFPLARPCRIRAERRPRLQP